MRTSAEESTALCFALAAGLKPQMSYTVADTSRYLGIPLTTLYDEIHAGRLRVFMPAGKKRGMKVTVTAVDKWLQEVCA